MVHPKNLGQDSFWLNVEKESLASEDLFEALEENFGSTAVSKARGEEKRPKKSAKALRVLDAKAAHSLSIAIQSSFSICSLQLVHHEQIKYQKFYMPHGQNEAKLTKKGIALHLRVWSEMRKVIETVNNAYPALATYGYSQDDHQNKLSGLECRECYPFLQ